MAAPAETIVTPPRAEHIAAGASILSVAFFFTAVMSALGKEAAGVPTATIVFFQNGIALLLFLPWASRKGLGGLKTEHPGLHLLRGLTGVASQGLMFVAVKRMPLMSAVLLSNSAALFIPIVAVLWLKEKISAGTWAGLAVGFAGVVLILRPSPELLKDPAAVLALSAALCSAVAMVTVNRLSATEPTSRILFYYFSTASLVSAPLAVVAGHPPTGLRLPILMGIGGCMAASQLLVILAYHYATPSRVAPFNYTVVVFSGLIGWLVWHSTPDPVAIVGVLLVATGGAISTTFGGPNSRGHFLWIGHWNLPFLHAGRPKPAGTP